MVGTGRGAVRKSRDLDPGLAMPGPLCTPEQGNGAGMQVGGGLGGCAASATWSPRPPAAFLRVMLAICSLGQRQAF